MAEAWQDRFWTSGEGLRLHARDYAAAAGDARLPVICLHGLTRNARDFEDAAPWLAAQGRRVLAIDVRGRGLSAYDPAADYRLPAYVDDVLRLARALAIARAVFVGTSMGGLITIALAVRAPELVAAAVVNDVGPEIARQGLARIAGYVGKAPPFEDWESAADYVAAQNREGLPDYGAGDWRRMARRLFREEAGRIVADYDPAIARPFADAPSTADPWAAWAALVEGRRVLVLRGALSDMLDARVAARMIESAADTRLVTIDGVGHAPMLDEPQARAAIVELLDRTP